MDTGSHLLSGRYELHEQVGTGGMAVVHRARDLNLQRDVAIKILKDDWISDPQFQSNFQQEARAAANLSHPHIVTIFDYGHDGDRLFIVMEYIQGTDLKTLIRRVKRLAVTDALDMMIKICQGIGYAHRAGLIHCDLKPQNILIAPDGGVKITDFGISRALASIHPEERTEIVWGSPLYFSPEQARGEPPSPASDVYSLGIMFYEMLVGEPPFKSSDPAKLAEMHIDNLPASPRSINAEIPVELEMILLKILSKEPAARYRTADQLGRILSTFAATRGDSALAAGQIIQPESAETHLKETMALGVPPPLVQQVDWLAVGLGLAAFLALGGLLPVWLWVCLLYPSCPINPG